MFNFLPELPEESRVSCNPPILEKPIVSAVDDGGVVRNVITMVPADNLPYFRGVHFSRETMSLRAKLNLGVPMSRVSLGPVENDPMILNNYALKFEQQINEKLLELDRMSKQSSVEP